MIGAGSFGTALAVLLARGGLRTTLQTRTAEQAAKLDARAREPRLPARRRAARAAAHRARARPGSARADYVFLAVPSRGLGEVIATLGGGGLGERAAVVSVAKGLVPPDGLPPTIVLSARFGAGRVACLGGPAHAQEMVHDGAGLVAASSDEELAGRSRRCSPAPASSASSPTIPSASSWPAPPRTPRRSPPARPRRRG